MNNQMTDKEIKQSLPSRGDQETALQRAFSLHGWAELLNSGSAGAAAETYDKYCTALENVYRKLGIISGDGGNWQDQMFKGFRHPQAVERSQNWFGFVDLLTSNGRFPDLLITLYNDPALTYELANPNSIMGDGYALLLGKLGGRYLVIYEGGLWAGHYAFTDGTHNGAIRLPQITVEAK